MSLKDLIASAEDIPSELMIIDEWGVEVLLRGMIAGQRLGLLQRATNQRDESVDMQTFYPEVLVLTVHDPETQEPVFTLADRELIMGKSSAVVERLATAGLRLSGFDKTVTDELGKTS